MRILVTLALAAAVSAPAVLAAPSRAQAEGAACPATDDGYVPAPIRGRGYSLVKDWDFTRKIHTLDALRSQFFTRFAYANGTLDTLSANGEWERYRDNDNHRVENGTLELIAWPRGGLRDGGIESGMVRSRWTGEYGYFEARMKVPPGRGLWPAFWIIPDDQRWPPEIDVVEVVNNGRDTTRRSFHNINFGKNPVRENKIALDKWGAYHPPFDYKDGFHTFSVEWTPDTIRHFVDGKLLAVRHAEWRHDDGSDAGPANIIVNLAVGGKWPGPPDASTPFPAILRVSCIRVWQKTGAAK